MKNDLRTVKFGPNWFPSYPCSIMILITIINLLMVFSDLRIYIYYLTHIRKLWQLSRLKMDCKFLSILGFYKYKLSLMYNKIFIWFGEQPRNFHVNLESSQLLTVIVTNFSGFSSSEKMSPTVETTNMASLSLTHCCATRPWMIDWL